MIFAIDRFMDYLKYEKNLSDNTVLAYSLDLKSLHGFLCGDFIGADGVDRYGLSVQKDGDTVSVSSVTGEDLSAYVEYMFDEGLSRATRSRRIAAIRSFFGYLYRNDFLKTDPSLKLIYPKKEGRLPKFLRQDETDAVTGFKPETFQDYRDLALLELLYSSGCRIGEVAGAEVKDLDLNSRRLMVTGKGSVQRIVFLTDAAADAMDGYLVMREKNFGKPSGPLFVNIRGQGITERGLFYIVRQRASRAGLMSHVTPHTFRHTFATDMLNAGADIRAVQEMLGHRNLSTTQIYTHTTKEHLRWVYEHSHPQALKDKRKN